VPLGEFLDGFYLRCPDRAAMADMLAAPLPAALRAFEEALLAATVEQLAAQWGMPRPQWVADAGYRLVQPRSLAPAWFPPDRLQRGPEPFQNRLLLTDPDPLRRAMRPALPLPSSR